MPGSALPWFALMVKPRHEKAVSSALRGRGYEEFLPTYPHQHRSARGFRKVELPLFSTYTFCRLDPIHTLPVLSIPGVLSIVSTGRRPAPVATEEIASLRTMVESGLQVEPHASVFVGDRVCVLEGPLKGLEGILVGVKNTYRVVITISLLGRSVSAEVDRRCIRKSTPIPRVNSCSGDPGAEMAPGSDKSDSGSADLMVLGAGEKGIGDRAA